MRDECFLPTKDFDTRPKRSLTTAATQELCSLGPNPSRGRDKSEPEATGRRSSLSLSSSYMSLWFHDVFLKSCTARLKYLSFMNIHVLHVWCSSVLCWHCIWFKSQNLVGCFQCSNISKCLLSWHTRCSFGRQISKETKNVLVLQNTKLSILEVMKMFIFGQVKMLFLGHFQLCALAFLRHLDWKAIQAQHLQ